jgi:DNA-directed RNA polymerase II subunit RPB2
MTTLSWDTIEKYFRDNENFLVKHHMDSYHEFIATRIKYTIQTLNNSASFTMLKYEKETNKLKHRVQIFIGGINGDEIFIGKPVIQDEDGNTRALLPNEARIRDLDYMADIYCNVLIKSKGYNIRKNIAREDTRGKIAMLDKETEDEKILTKVKIGSIPIMIRSKICPTHNHSKDILESMGECSYDKGGYFIVAGKEKVIVSQESMTTNRVFVKKVNNNDKVGYMAAVRCTAEDNTMFPKKLTMYVYHDKYRAGARKNAITIAIPGIGNEKQIPICIMFRMLGVCSDKDIARCIITDLDDPKASREINSKLLDFLSYSFKDGSYIYSQYEALNYYKKYVTYKEDTNHLKHILTEDFLPNIGKNFQYKAYILGMYVNQIIRTCLGILQPADRDNYMHKRIHLSGFLIGALFRDGYNELRNNIMETLDRNYNNYSNFQHSNDLNALVNVSNQKNIFNSDLITKKYLISLKGNWGGSADPNKETTPNPSQQAYVQDLNRLTYLSYISHIRRLNTPGLDPTSKIIGPHKLYPSHYGIICPYDTPDGGNVGILKHLAITALITTEGSIMNVKRCLIDHNVMTLDKIDIGTIGSSAKVLVNDIWFGNHSDPVTLYKKLKLMKLTNIISVYTSISWNVFTNIINVRTEGGRAMRPVFRVNPETNQLVIKEHMEKGKTYETWNSLISGEVVKNFNPYSTYYKKMILIDQAVKYNFQTIDSVDDKLENDSAVIEYIDVEETNYLMIAMSEDVLKEGYDQMRKYTHCEIHPSLMFGVYSNTIPMIGQHTGPRSVYSAAQGKQAIGISMTNYNYRIDTDGYVQNYPQKPIVHTRYTQYCKLDEMPNGANPIVAMCTYSGYNQEDAVIINQSAIDRGMFNITIYKHFTEQEEQNKKTGGRTFFVNPKKLKTKQSIEINKGNYSKIDDEGIPYENEYIQDKDVFIGKCSEENNVDMSKEYKNMIGENIVNKYTDRSKLGSRLLSGFVDKIYMYSNDGNKKLKIRLRNYGIPEFGDKVGSRYSQKGVIGMILKAEDMPFTKDGIIPDIIINPHALPTRMTVSHMFECLFAKVGCLSGRRINCTAFDNANTEDTFDVLQDQYGMNKHGDELLYNGKTGTQIPTKIFIGPIFYYRLKQLVKDKINYRAGSKVNSGDNGKVSNITRQPPHGRSNDGGLKIGEMEMNVLIGHGIGSFIKESIFNRSDAYTMMVNDDDGTIPLYNIDSHTARRDPHTSATNISQVHLPYTFKMFLYEMMSLNIFPRLITDKVDYFNDLHKVEEQDETIDPADYRYIFDTFNEDEDEDKDK